MHEKTRYFEANRVVSWPLGYAKEKSKWKCVKTTLMI